MISNPSFSKSAIRQQRKTKIADADQNHRLQPRGTEFIGNFGRKFSDVVTEAAGAERAEAGEVFAELRGFDAGGLRQRLAGNRADAILAQPRQAAQVNRETVNRLARDDGTAGFFQGAQK